MKMRSRSIFDDLKEENAQKAAEKKKQEDAQKEAQRIADEKRELASRLEPTGISEFKKEWLSIVSPEERELVSQKPTPSAPVCECHKPVVERIWEGLSDAIACEPGSEEMKDALCVAYKKAKEITKPIDRALVCLDVATLAFLSSQQNEDPIFKDVEKAAAKEWFYCVFKVDSLKDREAINERVRKCALPGSVIGGGSPKP